MDKQDAEAFAPLIGGLVAGVGATVFAAHFPVRPEALAMGIGTVGLAIASQTKGIVQRAALGFAAAGASMLAVEVIRRLKPNWQPEQLPQRQASNDFITRKELDEILARNAGVPTERRDHLDVVASKLTPQERATLERLRATAPRPIVAEVERQLRAQPVDDAVRFLRERILPNAPRG
jgi:hypothetical protein